MKAYNKHFFLLLLLSSFAIQVHTTETHAQNTEKNKDSLIKAMGVTTLHLKKSSEILEKLQQVTKLKNAKEIKEKNQQIEELKTELKKLELLDENDILSLLGLIEESTGKINENDILLLLGNELIKQLVNTIGKGIKLKNLSFEDLILSPEGITLREILIRFIVDLKPGQLSEELASIEEIAYSIRLLSCLMQPKVFNCQDPLQKEQRQNLGQVLASIVAEIERLKTKQKINQIMKFINKIRRLNMNRHTTEPSRKLTPEETRKELGKHLGKMLAENQQKKKQSGNEKQLQNLLQKTKKEMQKIIKNTEQIIKNTEQIIKNTELKSKSKHKELNELFNENQSVRLTNFS